MENLELYLHIPFCVRKCAYCDFLSHTPEKGEIEAYVKALKEEITSYKNIFDSCQVSTIFFGGGTPSLLTAEQMKEILDGIWTHFRLEDTSEITMELNPGTATREHLIGYRSAGVNRLSIGLQSVHDKELKMLGRIHDYQTFLNTYQGAREGTPFYEIYGEKNQETEQSHGEKQREEKLPSEEEERLMYERTREILAEYGYQQYEISNYAKPGYECRHNLGYWERVPYLGLGTGASSLIRYQGKEYRFHHVTEVEEYIKLAGTPEKLVREPEEVVRRAQIEEFMFLGLRKSQGIGKSEFRKRFGVPIEEIYGDILQKQERQGLIRNGVEQISLTERGMDLSNYVFAQYL